MKTPKEREREKKAELLEEQIEFNTQNTRKITNKKLNVNRVNGKHCHRNKNNIVSE